MFYAIVCANATMSGIDMIENRVDTDTIFAESSVSPSNREVNIVTATAIGVLIEIILETNKLPLNPNR